MTAGDLITTSSGKKSTTRRRTAIHYCRLSHYFPQFTPLPEGKWLDVAGSLMGIGDIDFESHPGFSSDYHLSSNQPETIRQVFNRPILDYFRANRGWEIRAERREIVMIRPELVDADGAAR